MANSVDPDQTVPLGAVWSGSALFAYAILLIEDFAIQIFWTFTIVVAWQMVHCWDKLQLYITVPKDTRIQHMDGQAISK